MSALILDDMPAGDPLISAIRAHREGMAAFDAIKEKDWPSHGGEDAVIQKTYGGPLAVLDEWEQPAQTREAAIAALRFIVSELDVFDASDGISSLVKAALSYLERANTSADLNAPIANHRIAFKAWCDTSDEEWDTPAALAAGDLIDAAQDAILNHRPATIEDARAKASYMASCRTFHEWDSVERIKLIEALTPADVVEPIKLQSLIASFLEAKRVYNAIPEDEDNEGPEWEAYEATEQAVLAYPCQTIEEVRLKARFFLDNDGPYDTIRNCFDSTEETLRPFLRSLMGEVRS